MKRILDFLAVSRDELIDQYINPIKYKADSIITGVSRCFHEFLIKGNMLTFLIDAIVLDNRINTICNKLDSLNQTNISRTSEMVNCTGKYWLPKYTTSAGRYTEGIVKSYASDLYVEIGSHSRGPSKSWRRACKRDATCDTLCQKIDRSSPLELRRHQEKSQIIFEPRKHSSRTERNDSARIKPCSIRERKKRRTERGVVYRLNPPRENWKNGRLKILVCRRVPGDCDCLVKLRSLKLGRLKLPCKPAYLMLEIFQADPVLSEFCLIVMRRKFEDGIYNVCSVLNNILGKMDNRMIKGLRLNCEISPDHINFILKSRSRDERSKVYLFVTRIPICRSILTHDVPKESKTFSSNSFEHRESKRKVEVPRMKSVRLSESEEESEEKSDVEEEKMEGVVPTSEVKEEKIEVNEESSEVDKDASEVIGEDIKVGVESSEVDKDAKVIDEEIEVNEESSEVHKEASELREEQSEVIGECCEVYKETCEVKERESEVNEGTSTLYNDASEMKEAKSKVNEENYIVYEEPSRVKIENIEVDEENTKVDDETKEYKNEVIQEHTKAKNEINEIKQNDIQEKKYMKSQAFYSLCSNDSPITDRNVSLREFTMDSMKTEAHNVTTHQNRVPSTVSKKASKNEEESYAIWYAENPEIQFANKGNQEQSIQCQDNMSHKSERITIAPYHKHDIHRDGHNNNIDEIMQTDVAQPIKHSHSTQVSRNHLRDSATDGKNYLQTIERGSSAVYRDIESNMAPRTETGSKSFSIHIIQSRSGNNWTMEDKHLFYSSQSSGNRDERTSTSYVSRGFNNVSPIPIKKRGSGDCLSECAMRFNKTEAVLRSLMSVRTGISGSSSEEHYHIRRSKIRLISRMLHSHNRSPTNTFVKSSLRSVQRAKSPIHYTIRISSNSVMSMHRIQSPNETSCQVEPNSSLFSRMKRRALLKSHRLKSRIYYNSVKSLKKIKHLIHRKLRQILLAKEDKGTNTSKLVLGNNGYVISVSRGKSSSRRIICEPYQSKIPRLIDEKLNSRYVCACRHACKGNRRKENSYNKGTNVQTPHFSRNLKKCSFDSMQAHFSNPSDSHCLCYKTMSHENERHSRRKNCSNECSSYSTKGNSNGITTLQWNNCRKRDFSTKNSKVSEKKHAQKKHSITGKSRGANKKYDSRYRNIKCEEQPIPSNDECFLQVSKLIGLTNTCEQCINDIETDFRTKLTKYVTLCRSAKDSLIKEVRNDGFHGNRPSNCNERLHLK